MFGKIQNLGKDWVPLTELLTKDKNLTSGWSNYSCSTAGATATLAIREKKLFVGVRADAGKEPAAVRINEHGKYEAIATLQQSQQPPSGIDKTDAVTWFKIDSIPEGDKLWLEVQTRQKAIAPAVVKDSKSRGSNGKGAA